jgi:hypothetical protein
MNKCFRSAISTQKIPNVWLLSLRLIYGRPATRRDFIYIYTIGVDEWGWTLGGSLGHASIIGQADGGPSLARRMAYLGCFPSPHCDRTKPRLDSALGYNGIERIGPLFHLGCGSGPSSWTLRIACDIWSLFCLPIALVAAWTPLGRHVCCHPRGHVQGFAWVGSGLAMRHVRPLTHLTWHSTHMQGLVPHSRHSSTSSWASCARQSLSLHNARPVAKDPTGFGAAALVPGLLWLAAVPGLYARRSARWDCSHACREERQCATRKEGATHRHHDIRGRGAIVSPPVAEEQGP